MKVFDYNTKVYYEDTDAVGFVYHANYLKYAERARSEWLAHLGFPVQQLVSDLGGFFVVRSCQIDFRGPARLGDCLEIRTTLQHHAGARLTMRQLVDKGDKCLVELAVVLAFVDPRGRPKRIPEKLIAAIA